MQDDKQKINKVRLCADSGKFDSPKNDLTNLPISFRAGDSVCFDIVLLHNNKLVDCSNLSTITLEILDVGAPNSPLPRNPRLLVKKIVEASQVQTTLTQEEFESGGKHLSILLNSSDTALKQKYYYLKLCAFDEYGNRATFASGWILIEQVYGSEIITDKEQINFIEELEGIVNRQIARVDETLEQFDVLKCELENKADKSSTLLGYGINDAYTKAEADLKISTATQALQLFKSNSGMLHFVGNSTATASRALEINPNCSRVFRFKMTKADFGKFSSGEMLFFDGAYSSETDYGLGLRKYFANNTTTGLPTHVHFYFYYKSIVGDNVKLSIAVGNNENFEKIFDGKFHNIAMIVSSDTQTNFKIYLDNTLIGNTSGALFNTFVANKVLKLQSRVGNNAWKDVYAFNFDMSDANAPYTLSDYQEGKPIPPEYLLGGGERFNFVRATENTDWNLSGFNCSGSLTEADGVYTLGKGTLTEGQTNYQSYLRVKFSSVIKAGSQVEIVLKKVGDNYPYLIRFTANAFTTTNTGDYKLLNDTRLWSNDVLVDNKIELTNDCNGAFIQLGNSFDTFSFTDFQIKVNGALLALENYTITNGTTKQIFDYSGNANDATCSGSVKGDNDNRVQRLVDFIKA